LLLFPFLLLLLFFLVFEFFFQLLLRLPVKLLDKVIDRLLFPFNDSTPLWPFRFRVKARSGLRKTFFIHISAFQQITLLLGWLGTINEGIIFLTAVLAEEECDYW